MFLWTLFLFLNDLVTFGQFLTVAIIFYTTVTTVGLLATEAQFGGGSLQTRSLDLHQVEGWRGHCYRSDLVVLMISFIQHTFLTHQRKSYPRLPPSAILMGTFTSLHLLRWHVCCAKTWGGGLDIYCGYAARKSFTCKPTISFNNSCTHIWNEDKSAKKIKKVYMLVNIILRKTWPWCKSS